MIVSCSKGTGFTAHLEVDFRKPLFAPFDGVFMGEVESVDGRKVWLKGRIFDKTGKVLHAEGRALFIVKQISGSVQRYQQVAHQFQVLKDSLMKKKKE